MIGQINIILLLLFFACYIYQMFYIPVSWLWKAKPHKKTQRTHVAVLIAARNEEKVIGTLIDSIRDQDYPSELIDIYVVADNCTDTTAKTASSHGATVFERNDTSKVGKGYALNFLLSKLKESGKTPDAYLVLDADNVLSRDFITEINRTYSDGYEIVTCYRNSKNFGDSWVSAGYGLWFLREAKYLNASRMLLGTSCAISGTGFMFSHRILEKRGGWHYFLLTEDIEFTADNIINGEKIGYSAKAVLYDEQPVKFSQSWRQRMRWTRGNMDVLRYYCRRLFRGMFKGSFSCYDMLMCICPGFFLFGFGVAANAVAIVENMTGHGSWALLGASVLRLFFDAYLAFYLTGLITTVTEWKQIHAPAYKKILYTFTFPLFMMTYLPIGVAACFKKVGWKPIVHDRVMSLKEIKSESGAMQNK